MFKYVKEDVAIPPPNKFRGFLATRSMNQRDVVVVNSTIDYLTEKGGDKNFLHDYATRLENLNEDEDLHEGVSVGDYISLRLLEVFG